MGVGGGGGLGGVVWVAQECVNSEWRGWRRWEMVRGQVGVVWVGLLWQDLMQCVGGVLGWLEFLQWVSSVGV